MTHERDDQSSWDGGEVVGSATQRQAEWASLQCRAAAESLAERARTWCRSKGIRPHAALDIAAALTLASVASGIDAREALLVELAVRCRDYDPDAAIGLEQAAGQLLEYLDATMV